MEENFKPIHNHNLVADFIVVETLVGSLIITPIQIKEFKKRGIDLVSILEDINKNK